MDTNMTISTQTFLNLDDQKRRAEREALKDMSDRFMEPFHKLIINAKTQFYEAYINGAYHRAAYLAIWHPFGKIGPVLMCFYGLLDDEIVYVFASKN